MNGGNININIEWKDVKKKWKKRREREDFIACLVSLQLRSLYIFVKKKDGKERRISLFCFCLSHFFIHSHISQLKLKIFENWIYSFSELEKLDGEKVLLMREKLGKLKMFHCSRSTFRFFINCFPTQPQANISFTVSHCFCLLNRHFSYASNPPKVLRCGLFLDIKLRIGSSRHIYLMKFVITKF